MVKLHGIESFFFQKRPFHALFYMLEGDTETAKKMTTDTLSTRPPASKLDSDDEVEAGKITDSTFFCLLFHDKPFLR